MLHLKSRSVLALAEDCERETMLLQKLLWQRGDCPCDTFLPPDSTKYQQVFVVSAVDAGESVCRAFVYAHRTRMQYLMDTLRIAVKHGLNGVGARTIMNYNCRCDFNKQRSRHAEMFMKPNDMRLKIVYR